MSVRPSLVRNIPFWILIVGSVTTAAFGLWLAIDKLGVMSVGLADGTATPVDVYVGQVWAIVGGILIATGIVGLALALVVAAIRAFVPVTDVEIVEAMDWSSDDPTGAERVEQPVAAVLSDEPVLVTEPASQR
ncbi:MAG: dinucleotide-utilizing enzyme [Microbacterium sp.]